MLRVQCFHDPIPPWKRTTSGPWPLVRTAMGGADAAATDGSGEPRAHARARRAPDVLRGREMPAVGNPDADLHQVVTPSSPPRTRPARTARRASPLAHRRRAGSAS